MIKDDWEVIIPFIWLLLCNKWIIKIYFFLNIWYLVFGIFFFMKYSKNINLNLILVNFTENRKFKNSKRNILKIYIQLFNFQLIIIQNL